MAAGNPAVTSLLTADWLRVAGGALCCLREDRAVQVVTCASCLVVVVVVVEPAVNRKTVPNLDARKCLVKANAREKLKNFATTALEKLRHSRTMTCAGDYIISCICTVVPLKSLLLRLTKCSTCVLSSPD